ncbi:TlpA disulfide reductase family protein [Pedobacter sp. KR3-3]|uniref:TlpA disulfide reductase family protein n=1 Tax=Pedobacter albus TaxID=3113905 RepID=A0ABU7I2Y9_9SPHI|nr:TlpA disulfide reductase family protein [Pedobacter sp. KR3-3]MEE1943808.1 TlpA disulfide reductase family protein [Pedobacter sp. KR3-3]
MKKSTLLVVLALLCLNFWASAQQQQAIDIISKGLQVGQVLPALSLDSVINFPTKTLATSSFRGKLLIIDFWATWCGPCIGMFPKMEQLQQQFKDKVQFLAVTYQQSAQVKAFLQQQKAKHATIPLVSDDERLHRLFPHVYLPHYVWIDENGVVRAITGYEAIDAQHLEQMLAKQHQSFEMKHDSRLDLNSQNLFLSQNAPVFEQNLKGYSYFSGFIEGLSAGYAIYPNDTLKGKRLTATNLSLMNLFAIAYRDYGNFGYKNMVFMLKDSSQLSTGIAKTKLKDWAKKHTYCFEVVVASDQSEPKLFYESIRRFLAIYLPQYQTSTSYRQQACLALVRTSDTVKFAAHANSDSFLKVDGQSLQIQNQHFTQLIRPLATYYLQNIDLPLIDETGYTAPITLSLQADMGNLESINKALKAYDLALVEKIGSCPIVNIKEL